MTTTVNGKIKFGLPAKVAKCSSNLTLTNSMADVPGCSITLEPGYWEVIGEFDFQEGGAGDLTNQLQGSLTVTGGSATITTTGTPRMFVQTVGEGNTVTKAWYITVLSATIAQLQAAKSAGSGSSVCGTQSTISGFCVGTL